MVTRTNTPPLQEGADVAASAIQNKLVRKVALKLGQKVKGVNNPELVNGVQVLYDDKRKELLEMHYWAFAAGLSVLTKHPSVPPFGFSSYFLLPADYVAMVVNSDSDIISKTDERWTEVGNLLATNQTSPRILYTKDVTNPDLFKPLFLEALTYLIAIDLCVPIARDKDLWERLIMESKAIKYDTFEADYRGQEVVETAEPDVLTSARVGVGGRAGSPLVHMDEEPI